MARESSWLPRVTSRTRKLPRSHPQLVADCQIEHGQVATLVSILQADADCPDIPRFPRHFVAYQLAVVAGFPMLDGFHTRLLGALSIRQHAVETSSWGGAFGEYASAY